MSDMLLTKSPRRRAGRLALPLAALAAAALLSGCAMAKRDSVIVGSVPDDYRTNHPIVISESEKVLDLPVGPTANGLTYDQKAAVEGFVARYDGRASPYVGVLVPSGSANAAAALRVADDVAAVMRRRGVPDGHIVVQSYTAAAPKADAPIRLSYAVMQASTGPCGRWPDDLLQTTDNKHYANFGCAYQNNLAAQVANPNDFLGPRRQTPIDAENRGVAIDRYKNKEPRAELVPITTY